MFLKIAWRNIWRNKRRTLITMASVFFAVILAIFMRSTITGVFEKMVNDVVRLSAGYIQIHRNGYWNERSVDNTFDETTEMRLLLKEEKEVVAWAPRLESFALASSGERTRGVFVMGNYPQMEERITGLTKKIVSGKMIGDTDNSIVIADGLSSYLSLKVKDTIVLLSQGYHGVMAAAKYPVKGIIKLGTPELNKSMVWLPMPACRNFLGAENKLTSISLLLSSENKIEKVKQKFINKISAEYEIMTWKEMLPELDQFIEADKSAHIITVNILYILISFGIFGTILMMLKERMHEFGILISIGMKKGILSFIVFAEIIFIAGLGTAFGMLTAFPVVYYFKQHPIHFTGNLARAYERYGMEPVIPCSTNPENFTSQAYIVFLIVIALSFYPIYKVNRINVMRAIKS